MSKKRYRSRPGQPRTQEEAMVRAMAMEILERDLAELEQEISILSGTVELYRHELNKRRANPDKEWGRWQVAPGVAMRAQSALRKLREKRDEMLAATEAEVFEQHLSKAAKQQVEEAQQTAASSPHATASARPEEEHQVKRASVPQPSGASQPARSRDPAAAA